MVEPSNVMFPAGETSSPSVAAEPKRVHPDHIMRSSGYEKQSCQEISFFPFVRSPALLEFLVSKIAAKQSPIEFLPARLLKNRHVFDRLQYPSSTPCNSPGAVIAASSAHFQSIVATIYPRPQGRCYRPPTTYVSTCDDLVQLLRQSKGFSLHPGYWLDSLLV